MMKYYLIIALLAVQCKTAQITNRQIDNVKADIQDAIESTDDEQTVRVLKDSKSVITRLEKENRVLSKNLKNTSETINGLISKNTKTEFERDSLKKENKRLKKGGFWKTIKKVGFFGGAAVMIALGFKLGIFSMTRAFVGWLFKRRKNK